MTSMTVQQLLDMDVFGNTVRSYVLALALFLWVVLVARVLKQVVVRRLRVWVRRTPGYIDDFFVGLFRHVDAWVYVTVAVWLSQRALVVSDFMRRGARIVLLGVLTVKAVQVLDEGMRFFLRTWTVRQRQADPTSVLVAKNLMVIIRVALWVGGLIFVLDNLGVNITAFVAGLGIGGVAIALAAQTVLGDAFSSFAIFMDRPFEVGDAITVDGLSGTVEYIGIKTTRLRSVDGEQVVFSNSDLTRSRIRNYKRMESRRIAFKLGIVYDASLAQLKAVPTIIERAVKEQARTRFEHAHFQSFGEYGLMFEISYFVDSPSYRISLDTQQGVNLRIKEEFERAGITIAHPALMDLRQI